MTTSFLRSAGALAVAATLVTPRPGAAQVSCASLPNPLVVAGTPAFDSVISQFILALAGGAGTAPVTFVYPALSSPLLASCAAVEGVASGKDLGGSAGRYYTATGGALFSNECVFAPGQAIDLAISEVFYETCANAPQPRPAQVIDAPALVQPAMLVVPNKNVTVQYVTAEEVRSLYGCGVSASAPIAGFFSDPTAVWCRSPAAAGAQVAVARNVGLTESVLTAHCGNQFPTDAILATALRPQVVGDLGPDTNTATLLQYAPPDNAISFVAAPDFNPSRIKYLAFRAAGQLQAFYPDSTPSFADRMNVRDGHYPLWGYAHLIARSSGGQPRSVVSDLNAWMNGMKSISGVDTVQLESRVGFVPLCAMKVQRAADGGLLRPYAPPEPCACAFAALSAHSIQPGCTPCLTASTICPDGKSCHHGFCE